MDKPDFNIDLLRKPLSYRPDVGLYGNSLWKNKNTELSIIDFDVVLPISGKLLQRPLVWTLAQKQSLIESMLKDVYIPPISYVECQALDNSKPTIYIIDGKQRLNAYFDFLDNKFPIIQNDIEYYYKDLNGLAKALIFDRSYNKLHSKHIWLYPEDFYTQKTETFMLDWFYSLNFAGTPQEQSHFDSLFK